jgi:hypothetical protein
VWETPRKRVDFNFRAGVIFKLDGSDTEKQSGGTTLRISDLPSDRPAKIIPSMERSEIFVRLTDMAGAMPAAAIVALVGPAVAGPFED